MIISKVITRMRGIMFSLPKLNCFRQVGSNFKLLGRKYISTKLCSVGDNCWFQAVYRYKVQTFNPRIEIGENVMFSNNVHISAVKEIKIGSGCLFGSNIYIGDHSHGSTHQNLYNPNIPPALRPLSDIKEICIGSNVWICDGVIILAGANIGSGCIIGANSIVKGIFPDNCLIAGNPAKIIKRLNG